ncbi:MAG: hypothetical protein P8M12_04695 [Flavobacteriales bacterium]|nr:hypothetical protein [Flavobacteriales bacterium]
MKRMFFMLMVLPSFAISAQESNFEFKNPKRFEFNSHKNTKLSFVRSNSVTFSLYKTPSKKPLLNTAPIYCNEWVNKNSFEMRNIYSPNTVSVYQVDQFETPHVENLAAELFIGFLYELCRVIDNPQPLFCP